MIVFVTTSHEDGQATKSIIQTQPPFVGMEWSAPPPSSVEPDAPSRNSAVGLFSAPARASAFLGGFNRSIVSRRAREDHRRMAGMCK